MRQLAETSPAAAWPACVDKVGNRCDRAGTVRRPAADVGSAVLDPGARAAIRFLAGQSRTDAGRISVYGIGEGTTHAMALATDTAAGAADPWLGLLQPLDGPVPDLITARVERDTAAVVRAGGKTAEQADGVVGAWAAAVAQARTTGTVPKGPAARRPSSAILNPQRAKAVVEADRIDPVAEAARVPAGTHVLLTCSDSM